MTIKTLGRGDHYISSDYLILLAELAFEHGLALSQLLQHTGLDENLLLSPDTRVGNLSAIRFVERFCELTNDLQIAVDFGKRMTLSKHGALGYAAQYSETMSDAGEKVTRFLETRAQIFRMERQADEQTRSLLVSPRFHSERAAPFLILAFLTSIETICRTLVSENGKQARSDIYIQLSDHWLSAASALQAALPHCTIHVSDHNQLVWPASAFTQPLPFFNRQMETVTEQRLQKILTLVKEPATLKEKISRQLLENPARMPTVEGMASQLHMSAATLTRRLKAEGVSFQQLKDEVRFNCAQELLQEELSLDAIAAELGYSDASNFTKAFKNWAGESPAQFRNRLRDDC